MVWARVLRLRLRRGVGWRAVRRRRGAADGGPAWTWAGAGSGGPRPPRRPSRIARAACGRAACRCTRTKLEGRSGRCSVIGTCRPLIRLPSRSMGELPGNGSLPVIRWYIEQPRPYRSLRPSTSRPHACSGDM